MRPGQQNRRMRGRGSGNRKGANPLTRNYESNGPDVKIRGSAQQVAEKYTNLARDAQAAGDRVMAENYLQHAEHYNRIIAAAQSQLTPQQARDERDDDVDENEDEREESDMSQTGAEAVRDGRKAPAVPGDEPQPIIEGMPAEVTLGQESIGHENGKDRPVEGGETEAQAPRRPRRPRRSRARGDQPVSGDEAAQETRPDTRQQELVLPGVVDN